MDCAECTRHVHAALLHVPGVCAAQVFLGSEKAIVAYGSTKPDLDAIRKAVEQAGYQVRDDQTEPAQSVPNNYSEKIFRLLAGIAMLVVFITVLGEWLGLFEDVLQSVPVIVWAVLILWGGWSIFVNIVRSALQGRVISHTLMSMGVVAAAAVGAWPSALVVVLFMRVGDYIESYTSGKARTALKGLAELAPRTARVERDEAEHIIPVTEVNLGELVIVRPGEVIPVDGRVISGSGSVNQSSLSGESIPLEAYHGSQVLAASIVENGMLKVQAGAVGANTTFSQVIRLVEEAEGNQAQVQRTADVFAGYLLPVVLFVALLTLVVRRDPLAAAAVLVVACSCSFALATPIAMLASIGSAAKLGLLIKGGKNLELLEKVDVVFVDKTGTLTLGKPTLTDFYSFGERHPYEIVRLAAAVERYSEHPLANAVREKADELALDIPAINNFKNTPGVGVQAEVEGCQIRIVNKADVSDDRDLLVIKRLRAQGKSLLFVQEDQVVIGILAAADVLRGDVQAAMKDLMQSGIKRIVLVSGDHEIAVRQVAGELGIAYQAGMLPQDKIIKVRQAQSEGHMVAMIGDGVNDAPALAQADVGIAMGVTGSDISNQAAKITLLREDWRLIPELFFTARRTMRVVRINIVFTMLYNVIGLSLAALGLLPPMLAAALQSLPDLGILVNSSRLIKTR